MSSSATTFQQLVNDIVADRTNPIHAAETLYAKLTQDERLWLLDGDLGLRKILFQVVKEGYCYRPVVAGAIPRLGVPGIKFSDGPRGVQLFGKGTAFPATSTRAQAWDPAMEEEVGVAIGKELRSLGGNYFGGVCVNLAPNPKWGRAQESYGEDPLLIGTLGAALVRGVRANAMACVKHFALNSMENKRFEVDVRCEPSVLHESFFPHFRQCLVEGGAESVMSAYNAVNGEYAGDNAELLGVLRDTWGLEDVVVTSDWLWGTRNVAKSVKAGLDRQEVAWSDVERIGKRILRMELAYYARMAEAPEVPLNAPGCNEHRDLARRSAEQGMVLLKNDDILPLKPQGQRILVVGALAASTQTGDGGSSYVPDPTVVSPLEGLKSQNGVIITYLDGRDLGRVERECQHADVVFPLVGYTGRDEGEFMAGFGAVALAATLPYLAPHIAIAHGEIAGGDRKSLRLKRADEELLKIIVTVAGAKTIVAVESSGPVILPLAVSQGAAAIIMTGYGGCQLSYNITESEDDIADIDMNATSVVYDRFWGYRLLQRDGKRAAYPFGFGLGYGEFALERLQMPTILEERFFDVAIKATNTGRHASSAVIQIYAGKVSPLASDYTRVLVGFTRTPSLNPGESMTVTVRCRMDPLAQWDKTTERFKVPAGDYKIFASRYEGDPEAVCEAISARPVEWSVKAQTAG